jgi:hypothetical protein
MANKNIFALTLLSFLLIAGQVESKIAVAREFYYSNRKPVVHLETPKNRVIDLFKDWKIPTSA